MMDTPLIQHRKIIAFLIMVAVALMVASMDIYVPAMPLMRDHFGTTEFFMQLSLMVSPFASALVGIIFGRLSDIHGRCPLLFAAFGFFLVGGLGCFFADTIESFLVSRFVQSVGSGGISILGVVVIADMFHGIQYARYMSIYGALFPLVFATSPIVGAHLTDIFGWRSCFLFIFTAMLMVTASLRLLLPETLKKGDRGNQGGFPELWAKGKMLLGDQEFLLMSLGHALPISVSGLFVANASFVFIDTFEFTPTLYSLSQAIPLAFNLVGVLIYRHFIVQLGLKKALQIGAFCLCLFVLAASGLVIHQLPHTPFVILSIFCFSNFAMPFIVATCATRAFEIFPEDRGLSVSLTAFMRNFFLAVIVSTTGLFFNGTLFPVFMATIIVSTVVLSILLVALQRPLVFAGE